MQPPQKPPMKLFWCTTEGHLNDGFVVARSQPQAQRFQPGITAAELVGEMPRGPGERIGRPSDKQLLACGAEIAPGADGGRVVRLGGRAFAFGKPKQ